MKLRDLANINIWKNSKLWAVILLIIFLILFRPPILDTIAQRFRCAFYVATDIQSFQLNLNTPHAGEHVLPSAVQEMLALLRNHQVVSYKISEKIMNDTLLHQRIVESAWPRRMSPESNYKLIFIPELDNSHNCREVERRKEVVLVFCH
jgi:hypothetical protein